MRVLRFLFPIAFKLSRRKGGVFWSIVLHIAGMRLYYVFAVAVFLISLPVWFLLFLIPVLSAVFMILFLAFFFVLLVVGIIIPFYSAGGIVLGILNYKKALSVFDDRE